MQTAHTSRTRHVTRPARSLRKTLSAAAPPSPSSLDPDSVVSNACGEPRPPPVSHNLPVALQVLRDLAIQLRADGGGSGHVSQLKQVVDTIKMLWEVLEENNKGAMDSIFNMLRQLVIEEGVDQLVQVHVAELLETRARGWKQDNNALDYYVSKCKELGGPESECPSSPWPASGTPVSQDSHSLPAVPPTTDNRPGFQFTPVAESFVSPQKNGTGNLHQRVPHEINSVPSVPKPSPVKHKYLGELKSTPAKSKPSLTEPRLGATDLASPSKLNTTPTMSPNSNRKGPKFIPPNSLSKNYEAPCVVSGTVTENSLDQQTFDRALNGSGAPMKDVTSEILNSKQRSRSSSVVSDSDTCSLDSRATPSIAPPLDLAAVSEPGGVSSRGMKIVKVKNRPRKTAATAANTTPVTTPATPQPHDLDTHTKPTQETVTSSVENSGPKPISSWWEKAKLQERPESQDGESKLPDHDQTAKLLRNMVGSEHTKKRFEPESRSSQSSGKGSQCAVEVQHERQDHGKQSPKNAWTHRETTTEFLIPRDHSSMDEVHKKRLGMVGMVTNCDIREDGSTGEYIRLVIEGTTQQRCEAVARLKDSLCKEQEDGAYTPRHNSYKRSRHGSSLSESGAASEFLPAGDSVEGIQYTQPRPIRGHAGCYSQEIAVDRNAHDRVFEDNLKSKMEQLSDTQVVLVIPTDSADAVTVRVTGPSINHVLRAVALMEAMVHSRRPLAKCWEWVTDKVSLLQERANHRSKAATADDDVQNTSEATDSESEMTAASKHSSTQHHSGNAHRTASPAQTSSKSESREEVVAKGGGTYGLSIQERARLRGAGVVSEVVRHRTPLVDYSDDSSNSLTEEGHTESFDSPLPSPSECKDVEISFKNLSLEEKKGKVTVVKESPVRAFCLNLAPHFPAVGQPTTSTPASAPANPDKGQLLWSPKFQLDKNLDQSTSFATDSSVSNPLNEAIVDSSVEKTGKTSWRDFAELNELEKLKPKGRGLWLNIGTKSGTNTSSGTNISTNSTEKTPPSLFSASKTEEKSPGGMMNGCKSGKKNVSDLHMDSGYVEEGERKNESLGSSSSVQEQGKESEEGKARVSSKSYSSTEKTAEKLEWWVPRTGLDDNDSDVYDDDDDDEGEEEDAERERERERIRERPVTGWYTGRDGFKQPINIIREPLGVVFSDSRLASCELGAARGPNSAYARRRLFEKTQQEARKQRNTPGNQKTDPKQQTIVSARRVYSQKRLLQYSMSPLSRKPPAHWHSIITTLPSIQADRVKFFNPSYYEWQRSKGASEKKAQDITAVFHVTPRDEYAN